MTEKAANLHPNRILLAASIASVLSLSTTLPALSFSFNLPSGFDSQKSTEFETSLYYYSEAGDYIGQGQEVFFGPTDGDFSIRDNFDNGVNFGFNNRALAGFQNSVWWNANFAAPFEQLLQTGIYNNATRFPFQNATHPGLNFSGSGRGCNRSGGHFNVLDIGYGSNGSVNRFDAVFAQYCENEAATGTPALFGRVRYNANPTPAITPPPVAAPPVPEHPSNAIGFALLGGLAIWWKHRRYRTQAT